MKKTGERLRHSRFFLTSILVSLVLLAGALGAIKGLNFILLQFVSHEVEVRIENAAKNSSDRMKTVFDNLDTLANMLAHLNNLSEAKGLNLSSPLYVGALQDSSDRGYGGPVLRQRDYEEIASALQGEPALGYYADKGLLFAVPVANAEDQAGLDTFAMYRRYATRQGRSVFLPSLFENRGLTALCTFGEGDLVIANSPGLYDRLNADADVHEAMLDVMMRDDLSEPKARSVSSRLGDYLVYSVRIPETPLVLTGAINAEYFQGYFKDLFYGVGLGFCGLLLIFNLGLLLMHFGYLKREQELLQRQRKLVERYAYKVTPPILDLVDSHADDPDLQRKRELEGKGQEILAKTAQLREETMGSQPLVPPSEHAYKLGELLDLTLEDLKGRDKVKLLLNPGLPEHLYGDPEAISRFFNSFLGLMLRFKPQGLTFQLDGVQPDPKHVNLEVRINTECKALERKLVAGLKQSLQTKTEDLKKLEPHTLGLVIAARIIEDQGGTFSIDALPQGGLILNFKMQQKVLEQGTEDFRYKPPKPEAEPPAQVPETTPVQSSQSFELAPKVPVAKPEIVPESAPVAEEEIELPPPPPPPRPARRHREVPAEKPRLHRDGPVINGADFKASGMSYNRPEALKFAAGNQALYDKFKRMFAEYAQRKYPLIAAAYANEQWSEYIVLLTGVGKGAHSIGALRLDSMCKDLVRAAKALKAAVSSGEKEASYIRIHHAEMMDLLADIIADIEE